MSGMKPTEDNGSRSEPNRSEVEVSDDSVRRLLRATRVDPEQVPDLTRGVQKKLRVRSGGKFYADGWSTARHPPITTYLITSLMMLFAACVIYAILAPLSGAPEPAPDPSPVQVLPPPK